MKERKRKFLPQPRRASLSTRVERLFFKACAFGGAVGCATGVIRASSLGERFLHALMGVMAGAALVGVISIGLLFAVGALEGLMGLLGGRSLFESGKASTERILEPRQALVIDRSLDRADLAEGGSFVGRVVARSEVLQSPISGARCVAFRLVGNVGGDPVDDGASSEFDLEVEEGNRVHVAPAVALVDLEPDEPACVRASPALQEFLWTRGILHDPDGELLGEAILAEGDRAEVWGAAEERLDPDVSGGYRVAVRRTVLAATVLIRRASSPPGRG